ncbi:MAG: hypothetical protein PVF83_15355 [Anaerolineales bacterium]
MQRCRSGHEAFPRRGEGGSLRRFQGVFHHQRDPHPFGVPGDGPVEGRPARIGAPGGSPHRTVDAVPRGVECLLGGWRFRTLVDKHPHSGLRGVGDVWCVRCIWYSAHGGIIAQMF